MCMVTEELEAIRFDCNIEIKKDKKEQKKDRTECEQ